MPNKDGHRRFGNVRKLPSGRYQIRYPGPDGRMRNGSETYPRVSDAHRALALIESEQAVGEWSAPERGKVNLGDYAGRWIIQRPGLRPRTVGLYSWLLKRYISPKLGGVPLGKLTTPLIRAWRAELLAEGVSVSMTAKAYRLLRQRAKARFRRLPAPVPPRRRHADSPRSLPWPTGGRAHIVATCRGWQSGLRLRPQIPRYGPAGHVRELALG
jgi:hypothetical protein